MKKFFSALFCIFVLSSSAFGFQNDISEVLKQGDDYAARFDHMNALAQYENALKMYPESYEAAWKASREMAAIGNDQEIGGAEKDDIEKSYLRAVEFAQKAIDLQAEGVDANFSMAVAKGRLGLYKGKKEMIRLSKDVKTHVDIVLKNDPEYYKAHYLIARWHHKIANVNWFLRNVAKIVFGGLPPASNEEALQHYKRAIELNPEYVECHKELGRFYSDRKEWKLAVEILEKCAVLPESQQHDARFKEEAAALLEKARKKV